MSNQQTLIKETNELLEAAQKEVLREINARKGFFSRIFSSDSKDNLKQAQSAISKAINQMKNLTKDESSLVSKLQNHLNEKSSAIKKFEEEDKAREKDLKDLQERVKYYKDQFEKLQENVKNQVVEAVPSPVMAKVNDEEYEAKVKDLESYIKDYDNRLKASQDDLGKSQALSVELSRRIKRLKSELIN